MTQHNNENNGASGANVLCFEPSQYIIHNPNLGLISIIACVQYFALVSSINDPSFMGFGVKTGSSGALRFWFAHFASCARALTGKHEPH